MKKLTMILGITTLVLVGTTANAQLGRLKNLTKKKERKEKTTSEGKDKKALELDYTTFKFTPAITMSSLLYATEISEKGSTRLQNYTASFVPYKKKDGSSVSNLNDQSQYLIIKVFKGTEFIDYFEYDGDQTFDNKKLRKLNAPSSRYQKNGEWADGTNVDLKKWGEGMYRLEFYAGNKLFYNFDFEVYKVTNDDPYAELNEMYLSRGAWNKYAYMEHQKSGNMVFGFYMQHEEFQPNPSDPNKTLKDVKWTLNMTKDGKPFATNYNGLSKPVKGKVNRAKWTEMNTAMKSSDGKQVIKLSSLTDGAYKIEVKVDIEAKPRVYNFSVANNKIVLMDEQDRSKNTDPTRLVEGWNNFYWFKLE
ncbi:hypothetical protein Q4Q35_13315 [Flavivirga aquimarina]|uniref:Uncharacterized protein n=1 Tax=Flavivirga aquimarina TaxID=2027862 RepID=A0ABT8WCE6_9FLAO|nr:hypothetical protein [Flavivirga aquimarina]MDO5970790.1 hypothetical protein [Flavivirga aquimarina]